METNPTNEPLKVLGLTWDSKQDTLQLDLNPISAFTADKKITKRHVLRTISRILDPIGFLSPYVIRVKILFQELWEAGIEWDDRLPPDMALKFESWCNELSSFGSLALPRHYFFGLKEEDLRKISLITFTDASEVAYAACSYIRYVTCTGEIGVSFIASKSRVSPLKKLSLPRLELMDALLGARLTDYLNRALRFKIEDVKLFSDSMITLHWIKGFSRPWKPFVSNRVAEIQSLSEPTSWNHVKGSTNPADMPTRGKRADELINNQIWWEGPSWLKLEEDLWPASKFEAPNQEAVQEERRTIKGEVVLSSCVSSTKQPLLDLNRYSEYLKVKRISSWILRFIHNCRKPNQKRQGPLTAEELCFGEIVLIRQSQEETYEAEMHQLNKQKILPKTSPITDLDPQLDQDGLLFVKGRLEKGQFTFRQKNPWIKSGKSRLAELLASYHHRKVMIHAGLNDTLSSLREEFWITRGRQMVKKIVEKCGRCKRFRVKAAQQIVTPLPADRITPAQPFSITGVDFGGPLIVRMTKNSSQKCYIALLTCATTRAVHLELVTDLTTEKFLMAFRRFISRRGVPSVIYSDNARTFKRAEQDLKDIFANLKHPEVADFLSAKGISWKPILERAAWWGGFWERLIQSTKSILRKVIGRASLTYEELETFLIETEAILNSRPITYMYHNIDEPTPLSPSHFLTGQRQSSLPSRRFNTTDKMTTNRQELTKRFRYRQNLLDQLWNRWKMDYLFQLRTAHHQKQPKVSNELKEGDIVLIHELRTPRMLWKMGKISNPFVGRDQKIRSCEIKLANGTYLKRPVQLLYPLEC